MFFARSAFSIRGTRNSGVRCLCVKKIIDFCELNLEGGTHAAGPWWFGLWILEDREKTNQLFVLSTGIVRLRDLFLDTVWRIFLKNNN